MCCVLVLVCVPGAGSRSLLKLSQPGRNWQAWKILASLENTGSGTGGYSAVRITAVQRPETGRYSLLRISAGQRWQFLTIHIENVIISVTMITKMLLVTRRAKMPLYGAFAFRGIKSHWTAKNAVQRIYIKYGNTKLPEMYAVGGRRETAYLYIQKRHFVKSLSCGYKIVIILPLAFPLWRW